jgi:hypothetical protein
VARFGGRRAVPPLRTMAFVSMSAATPDPDAGVPATDPRAIRASLPQALVAEFDVEWDVVLEQAKHDMDLVPIRSLLTKWRHLAHAEMRDPGSTKRLYEKAAEIERTGQNPDAVSMGEIRQLVDRRLAR